MRQQLTTIDLPELGLVVLCGASGSGKSAFAARHFADTEIVSSDRCRALVGDDESDQSVTVAAFDLVHTIVDRRLEIGRLTVVDATNTKPADRAPLIELARKWDVLATAVVFDLPLNLCVERSRQREGRIPPEHAVKRQHQTLRRTAKRLRKERFGKVYTLGTAAELDAVGVTRSRLWCDRRHDCGPFDIIGDVHGCHAELLALLDRLGYDTGVSPVVHPDGRRAVFVGDLVDRGPGVADVLDIVMPMVEAGNALCVQGNHENKLRRALAGRNVQVTHGLAESLSQLEARGSSFSARVADFLDGLISHYVLDGGALVVAHAGLPERYHGRTSGRVRSLALYGDTDGESDAYGLPVRYPWAEDYRGDAAVVYGHTPVVTPRWVNNTMCVDTGAVFGGELTALRWPEKDVVSVPAVHEHYEPERPPDSTGGRLDAQHRSGTPLVDIGDVAGKRSVETELEGRITVEADRSSAALEVMSRFAVDPRWLVYLPPTMAPVATSQRPDCLEHPDEAFTYFRKAGVGEVVCQEKHMGSRAVLVMARDAETAAERFGISNDDAGVIVTRTGRPFFSTPGVAGTLLGRLRTAADAAGLWDQLGTDWLVVDTEMLPWTAKSAELLRRQYAATGAAGTVVFDAAQRLLAEATGRGVDVEALASRTAGRAGHLASFVRAYRQYCWDTDGADGIEIAPFQILAAQGEVLARRPHRWHLEQIDALVTAGGGVLRRTDRRFVQLDDAESVAEATGWWRTMTDRDGEGMVVKPAQTISRSGRGLVLPGVKCRGREYLRIIYGPEYLEPAHLERLRKRSLSRKSSLARREFALGIEALERFVANEHISRIHECVFGVLALESEPVDPRL
ncbi:polynucleotide kinase-phosphatase [Candidatus Poriferisodalis sp.]|uniref:polynucleotide kinase-phosphatase n=1 Tax=Candidatus Poriferisodalis sp. TaxID=3101277 RepID=UPI003B015B37